MKLKPHHLTITLVCLLLFGNLTQAQQKTKEPPKLFTDSKTIVGRLQTSKTECVQVNGTAIYQITACNADDTLVGTWSYTFTDQERQKIATIFEKKADEVPEKIMLKDVVVNFAKGTECPVLKLEFSAMDVALDGKNLRLNRFTLNLRETEEPLTKYICTMARNIKVPLPRRGPCRRVNEILNGEDEDK